MEVKMRKTISFVLALVMLLSAITVFAENSTEPAPVFNDVGEKAWFKSAVDFVSSNGIMAGDGEADTFRPNKLMNRAMVVTVLWRLEGEPATSEGYVCPFSDLKQEWYKKAVYWANENSIVNGKSDVSFEPASPITREELCAIIERYLNFKSIETDESGDISTFPDSSKVSKWALESIKWAVTAGVINGKAENGVNILAPRGDSTRAECATILMRICEKYKLLEKEPDAPEEPEVPEVPEVPSEPFYPASLEEILEDLKSDRVKKVIFDADAGNEIDDQYSLAHALSCEKFDVISTSASQFLNTALVPDRAAGMMEGYNEIKRVLALLGREDIPVYKGVGNTTTKPDDSGIKYPTVIPIASDASNNIINTVKNSNEIIYIIVTGCATNVACALARDLSIKDKICVIWLGGNHLDIGAAGEFNFSQDPSAARYMMNTGVPMIWLPAMSNDATKGTQVLKTNKAFLDKAFPGEDEISRFFGGELVVEHDFSFKLIPDKWQHTFWDVAAPIVLEHPELCEFEIIETPRIRGDEVYNIEEGRPKAIILNRITDPQKALDYMAEGINTFAK